MRITAQEKERTRRRILTAGQRLFARHGYRGTSTRDLAAAAGIATGTLFNYFPNKESLGLAILAEGLCTGRAAWREEPAPQSLPEDLFALVAAELRALEPCREYAGDVFDVALSPFAAAEARPGVDAVRTGHMECVAATLTRHDHTADVSLFTAQLYWTLYLGVLAFWARDPSPHQADTLALLDRSTRLFAASLTSDPDPDPEGEAAR